MYIERYDSLIGSAYPSGISVLSAGYAVCDGGWQGEVIAPPYSRLYFIRSGELTVRPHGDAEVSELRLSAGDCCIIPSGCSFFFCAPAEVSHIYFHLQIRRDGSIDALGAIDEPLTMEYGGLEIDELYFACSDRGVLSEMRAVWRMLGAIDSLAGSRLTAIKRVRPCSVAEAAVKIISESPQIGISLSYLAGRLHISERTLTRKFKAAFGVSVGEYIENTVLALCERELLHTDMTLLEISEKYGFCDRFYFTRKFKKRYGIPPRKYRERGML